MDKKSYKIVWYPLATETLELILLYLTVYQSESIALRVHGGIIETVEEIQNFPEKYQVQPYIKDKSVRYAIIWSYKILYRVVENEIHILLIFHTSLSPKRLNKILPKSPKGDLL